MFARLTALVSSGSSLPFELGEPFPSSWGAWTHYRATAKADGSAVSVFRVSAAAKQDPKLVAARNGVRRLKMVGAAVRARADAATAAVRALASVQLIVFKMFSGAGGPAGATPTCHLHHTASAARPGVDTRGSGPTLCSCATHTSSLSRTRWRWRRRARRPSI